MKMLLQISSMALLGAGLALPSLAVGQPAAAAQQAAGETAAQMQPDDDRCWIRFTEIDADDDGRIDAQEAKRHQARVMEIDKDRDGAISKEEFAACVKATPARPVRDEAAAAPQRTEQGFAAIDADKDGAATLAEYMTHAQRIWQAQNEGGGTMKLDAYAKSPLNVLSYDAATLDWNGDRKIASDEAAVDAWYNFVALDADENGRLTAEEWRDRKADKPGVPAAQMFAFMDRNDDGRISAAESAHVWDLARKQGGVVVEAVPVWVYQLYMIR